MIGLELNTEDMGSLDDMQDAGTVYVDRLVNMLELGDEFVVVGHSFGGEVAVAVESEPRGRVVVDVKGMLLVDAIPQAVELGEGWVEFGLMDGSLELEKICSKRKRAGTRAYNELVHCVSVMLRVQVTAWLC